MVPLTALLFLRLAFERHLRALLPRATRRPLGSHLGLPLGGCFRRISHGLWRVRRRTPSFTPQSHRPGQIGSSRRVGRSYHGVIGPQPESRAVFLRGHVVIGAQVTFQRLELLAIEQADDVIRPNGFVWWNDRFWFGRFSHAYSRTPERLVNGGD